MVTHRVVVVIAVVVGLLSGGLLSGCQDPCVTLAERICKCETTAEQRRGCIANRVTNQQSTVEVDDPDRKFCIEKLTSCSCAALDRNDLDACGFANKGENDGEDGE